MSAKNVGKLDDRPPPPGHSDDRPFLGYAAAALLLIPLSGIAGTKSAGTAHAAGGPYAVGDFEITAPGECGLETWAAFGGNRDRSFVVVPSCTFAALPILEFSVTFERARSDGSWATAIAPEARATVIPIERFGVGIGVGAGFTYDWTDHRVAGGSLLALMSVEPYANTRLNLNVGYEHESAGRRDIAIWGIGAVVEPVENLALIAEVFGNDGGPPGFQAGIRPTVWDGRIDFDLVVGRNVTGDRATWITVGTAFAF